MTISTCNQKVCSKCGVARALEQFGADKTRKDGLYPSCKPCNKAYREEHKEAGLATVKRWQAENPERVKAIRRDWYERNKEMVNSAAKLWAAQNPDKRKEVNNFYANKNREKINAANRIRIENLHDSYVIRSLIQGTKLMGNDIPKPLIQLKRAQMLIRRELKKGDYENRH